MNTLWAAVSLFAFAQTYCTGFRLPSESCRLFSSLGGEDRTSAQQKNSSGCGHSIFCWLFDIPEKSGLLARPLCKWGFPEYGLSGDVMGIPCYLQRLSCGLAACSIALYRCFWISRSLGCCGNQILGSLVVKVPCVAGLNLF